MKLASMCTAMALTAWASAGTAAQPAGVDRTLLHAAQAEQPAVIQSLEDMVKIESGSDDAEGVTKIADYAAKHLRQLGATTSMLPATNGQPPGLVEGVFHGTGTLRIVLQAHLDTVYRRGILATEPWRRDANKLFGPGIADDKGGVAVILSSLALLKQQGWKNYKTLTVLLGPDEEIGSPGSGSIIAKIGSDNDVVLSYEPSPAKQIAKHEGVLLSAAGTARMTLVVNGRAAHAGAAQDEGRNALVELASELVQTRDIAKSVPDTQLNWTEATGGTARNQIPGRSQASADVRFNAPDAPDKLLAAVKAKVNEQRLVPDTQSEVSLEIMRPMFVAGDKGLALAKLAQSIYAELGQGDLQQEMTREMPDENAQGRNLLLIPNTTGGTDAGFAGSSGKPAVLESMGLAGWGYHAKNEYIEVDSIVPRLYLTARMLQELGKQYPPKN
jgi:glutamate carboxypeptidase